MLYKMMPTSIRFVQKAKSVMVSQKNTVLKICKYVRMKIYYLFIYLALKTDSSDMVVIVVAQASRFYKLLKMVIFTKKW